MRRRDGEPLDLTGELAFGSRPEENRDLETLVGTDCTDLLGIGDWILVAAEDCYAIVFRHPYSPLVAVIASSDPGTSASS
jgi:hypothetical protein